jgi:hypothetical protein
MRLGMPCTDHKNAYLPQTHNFIGKFSDVVGVTRAWRWFTTTGEVSTQPPQQHNSSALWMLLALLCSSLF